MTPFRAFIAVALIGICAALFVFGITANPAVITADEAVASPSSMGGTEFTLRPLGLRQITSNSHNIQKIVFDGHEYLIYNGTLTPVNHCCCECRDKEKAEE